MTTWHGTRACRGCDGSGYDYKRPDLSTFDSFEDCMVCGGTGRVEARPPVSDAIADAETLLDAAANYKHDPSVFGPSIIFLQLMSAYEFGVSLNGRMAARAAFRAVPGLRG